MKKEITAIHKFREKFNLGIRSKVVDKNLHTKLIKEEAEELIEAIEQDDDANTLKEFVDLIYVVSGYLIDKGIEGPLDTMFNAVTANNMDKLGPDGKPVYREDGKLLKPEGFIKLNPQDVINNLDR